MDSNGGDILSFKEAQIKAYEYIDALLNQSHKTTVEYASAPYMKWFKENRKSVRETQNTIDARILPTLVRNSFLSYQPKRLRFGTKN